MKKNLYILLTACLLGVGSAYGQDNRKTVAVVPATGEDLRQSIKDGVTEGLLEGVVNSGQYRPVARDKDFDKVLAEMKFQMSGLVDDEQLIQFGKALRADYVCYASVNKYSERGYRISYKLIDVATAEILDMNSETVRDGIDGLLTATDNIAVKLFSDKRKNGDSSNNVSVETTGVHICGLTVAKSDLPYEYTRSKAMTACPSGWRLPTLAELTCVCENREKIGSYAIGKGYWSSTTIGNDYLAVGFFSSSCFPLNHNPNTNLRVRCVQSR